ncbi:MAG: nucleoside-diphosphate sugar epimerase/dehydratase [Clostridia bacterium]
MINASILIGLLLRFDYSIPTEYLDIFIRTFVFITLFNLLIFYFSGLYKSLWRYASIDELLQVFIAVTAGSIISPIFGFLVRMQLPRSVYLFVYIVMLVLIGGSRISFRMYRHFINKRYDINNNVKSCIKNRIMIIGAGSAGSMIIKELKRHDELVSEPVCVIDDDHSKHNFSIHGIPVMGGRDKIKKVAEDMKVDEIIIALPSATRENVSEILKICKETPCKLKTLPGFYELIGDRVTIKNVRDVSIEDLLGREEVQLNTGEISGYLEGEVVLITGAGGSIGSELCRQIAVFKPKKMLIFDIYENNAFDLQNELNRTFKNKLNFDVIIGSVRDEERVEEVFTKYRPTVVFHAAAHKHVPLMESNPTEAIKNNIFGTLNVAQCSDKFNVKRFVMISTDKAVNPTNVMGATKRMAEMIIQTLDKQSKTEFVAVRFGNVLGSNGSALPLFKKQIDAGGPVTVTHPEITRFFMTIPEASRLVIQAGAMAKGGEIFILDMGKPMKIVDLVKGLIRLSGYKLESDIEIKYIGLRPGEKLYEELLLEDEGVENTGHKSIFVAKPLNMTYKEVTLCLESLKNCLENSEDAVDCLGKVVSTFTADDKRISG